MTTTMPTAQSLRSNSTAVPCPPAVTYPSMYASRKPTSVAAIRRDLSIFIPRSSCQVCLMAGRILGGSRLVISEECECVGFGDRTDQLNLDPR